MPWRLIGFIILCGIFLAFIGFNLENRCTISFGFTEIPDMPVYLTAFASFLLGMLCAVPFIISLRRKKEKAQAKKADLSAPVQKKGGKAKPPAGAASGGDDAYGNDGSYGID